jgi:deoxycytidylate deaminase/dephospho-CoA kinase
MSKEKKKTEKAAETVPEGRHGRSNLVIGLTGPFGSGCSTMLSVLKQEFGFVPFKISEDIREELSKSSNKLIKKGKPGWRRVLQEHGNKQRKGDTAYWINKAIKRIDEKHIGDKDIVIDGFRNFKEVEEIRKIYPRFFLVAICAEKDERWKRVRDDYGGRYNEFEDDDRRDQNEDFDWGQSVQRCVDDADYVYYNNEHLVVELDEGENPDTGKIERKLKDQAKDFVPLMKEETECRPPRPEEIQIAAAYAQSHSSTCLKRHVGAVITVGRDGQQFPISMGFNENPPNIRTCKSEAACYKDEDMNSKLQARGKEIFCPLCGKRHKNLSDPWICKNCRTSLKIWLHPNRNMELCTAIHAEERAILSLGDRRPVDATLYVTTFPCFQCARLILDAGIKNVVYVEAYPVKDTKEFLKANGVEIKPFSGFTARAFFGVFPKVN